MNTDPQNKILDFFLKGSSDIANNIVKALLFGFIIGAFFFFLGRDFDFQAPYGLKLAIVSLVISSGILFLKYNSKK